MKRIIIIFCLLGITTQIWSQEVQTEELSEVIVMPVNYKYLDQVNNSEAVVPVQLLEKQAASYDLTAQDFFVDEYNYYTISVHIPEGKLVAVYNTEGEIIRTIERFKNVNVPKAVKSSLKSRFPNWHVVKDVYLVTYNVKDGAKKSYKFKLKNGDKVIRVKLDEKGEFL